jgi:hypothetical protein
MSNISRRQVTAIAAAATAGALSVSLAFAQVEVIVPVQPPAARVEVVPTVPTGRVWQPGYWRYEKDKYDWQAGRIVDPPRAGATWAPGRWEARGSGWVYIEGKWN